MVQRIRHVEFSAPLLDLKLKQIFPKKNIETIKTHIIDRLVYEIAPPRKDNDRCFFVYEIHNKKIAVYFLQELSSHSYEKILIKSIEKVSE